MGNVPLYEAKAELFRTLGHPVRIRVLELLQDGPRPVHELLAEIEVEASNLSAAARRPATRRAGSIVPGGRDRALLARHPGRRRAPPRRSSDPRRPVGRPAGPPRRPPRLSRVRVRSAAPLPLLAPRPPDRHGHPPPTPARSSCPTRDDLAATRREPPSGPGRRAHRGDRGAAPGPRLRRRLGTRRPGRTRHRRRRGDRRGRLRRVQHPGLGPHRGDDRRPDPGRPRARSDRGPHGRPPGRPGADRAWPSPAWAASSATCPCR